MKRITKGAEPAALSEWKVLNGPDLPGWSSFQNPEKTIVADALSEEQGAVCCYCNARLSVGDRHLEHYRPQSTHPELRYEWGNLLASCDSSPAPSIGKPPSPDRHCGHAKGSWFDATLMVSPQDPSCERLFRFRINGEVASFRRDSKRATTTITKLNLNEISLQVRRSAAIAVAFADVFVLNRDQWRAVYLEEDSNGEYPEFCGVLADLYRRDWHRLF